MSQDLLFISITHCSAREVAMNRSLTSLYYMPFPPPTGDYELVRENDGDSCNTDEIVIITRNYWILFQKITSEYLEYLIK